MKHRFYIKILILSITLLLPLLSCGDNQPLRLRYEAEKKYHEAETALRDARVRQLSQKDSTGQKIVAQYADVVEFCYSALDSARESGNESLIADMEQLVFRAATRLSQLYYARAEYSLAAKVTGRILDGTVLKGKPLLSGSMNLGRALHASGNWDSAATIYSRLLSEFDPPLDANGNIEFGLFNLSYYMYEVVTWFGDKELTATYYGRAESYYRRQADNTTSSTLSSASHTTLALMYHNRGFWEKEISELSMISDTALQSRAGIQMKIGDIYANQLGDYDEALLRYDKVLATAGQTDTISYPLALFRKALVAMASEKYGQARQQLMAIKKEYPAFHHNSPAAQLAIARSFEYENNWSRAETEYDLLLEKFSYSDEAFSTHLHLARHYTEIGRTREAERRFRKAGEVYEQAISIERGSATEARAFSFKAEMFRQQGEWSQAASTLTELFVRFPSSDIGRKAIVTAASIYRENLNDSPKADSLLSQLKGSTVRLQQPMEK